MVSNFMPLSLRQITSTKYNMICRIATLLALVFIFFVQNTNAQVNAVEFGKNRIQYKKMKWKFYQSKNFNTYVNQGGVELGAFVSKLAEEELPEIEGFIEYSLQRKANIFVYNSYDELRQSNIGLGQDWQNAGGITKLPNNKIVVYFDGNHNNLRIRLRQGIAKALLDNQLFGDDLGEVASNQALLDLPKWLTDGYISYAGENWSTKLDDDLKSALLNDDYRNFYDFAYKKPLLAGHSFWNYLATKYRKENVTYFLYLSRIHKNLNTASQKICKKKFKEVLAEFMEFESNKYYDELRKRKNQPKGTIVVQDDISKEDYFRYNVNPLDRNRNYVVTQFKKGIYKVIYYENFEPKVLLHQGVRVQQGDINPNYPILAWDVKGKNILCIYYEKGKTKMFTYDIGANYKKNKQELNDVDQVLDANFMLDANTLVMSAVKNGHTDVYTYKIDQQKFEQITNDVYDDLDPVLVSFPGRTGIIYASNRPSPNAPSSDTVLPSRHRFNIFLVDILNTKANKQITQLTNVKYGNARKPMQYNTFHFTYVSDENGIENRWAGFFSSQRDGLDTLYYVGDDIIRNPAAKELDSALLAWRKPEPDSISYFQVYKDSTYTFPITNYQSSLIDSRTAGNNNSLTETRREADMKLVYKLKINEDALKRRNINPALTTYMQQVVKSTRDVKGKATSYNQPIIDSAVIKQNDFFQTGFEDEKPDTTKKIINTNLPKQVRQNETRLFNTGMKFQADNLQVGFTNNILINRFQPYGGGQGPIQLGNGSAFNNTIRAGVIDLMEDVRFVGGFRSDFSLRDKEVFFIYENFRRRLDVGFTYYRANQSNAFQVQASAGTAAGVYNTKLVTNLYQGYAAYPIDEARSIKMTLGMRRDRFTTKPFNLISGQPDPLGLVVPYIDEYTAMSRIEYIHDNTSNPTMNIWNGIRWKAYFDFILPAKDWKVDVPNGTYILGFDARKYTPIYRNCIWALRASGDFSWGGRKMLYYLGGVDGWLNPQFNNNQPAADQTYAFQTLALNMRGYNQNIANGNNSIVINSELRLPVFASLINQPINNAFIRNFQLVQFIDLGTAWNGKFNGIQRPTQVIPGANGFNVKIDAGGLGPFAGGYGFGARSTLLGYFVKFDVAWPMLGLFKGKPIGYFALGLDF